MLHNALVNSAKPPAVITHFCSGELLINSFVSWVTEEAIRRLRRKISRPTILGHNYYKEHCKFWKKLHLLFSNSQLLLLGIAHLLKRDYVGITLFKCTGLFFIAHQWSNTFIQISTVPSISASVIDTGRSSCFIFIYRHQVFSLNKCFKMLQIVFFLLDQQICFALFLEHMVTVFFFRNWWNCCWPLGSTVAWSFVTTLISFSSYSSALKYAIARELLFNFRPIVYIFVLYGLRTFCLLWNSFFSLHYCYQFHW